MLHVSIYTFDVLLIYEVIFIFEVVFIFEAVFIFGVVFILGLELTLKSVTDRQSDRHWLLQSCSIKEKRNYVRADLLKLFNFWY